MLPLAVLQEGLAGGKDVAIKKIAEAYALSEGLPLIVKVTSKEAEDLQVALSAEQVEKFQSWQQSLRSTNYSTCVQGFGFFNFGAHATV